MAERGLRTSFPIPGPRDAVHGLRLRVRVSRNAVSGLRSWSRDHETRYTDFVSESTYRGTRSLDFASDPGTKPATHRRAARCSKGTAPARKAIERGSARRAPAPLRSPDYAVCLRARTRPGRMSGTLLIEAKRLAARWCVWRGSFQEPVVQLCTAMAASVGRLSRHRHLRRDRRRYQRVPQPALIRLSEGVELLSPSSLPVEVGNAFSAMFKRQRIRGCTRSFSEVTLGHRGGCPS